MDTPSFPLPDDQYVAPVEDAAVIAAWIAKRASAGAAGGAEAAMDERDAKKRRVA